MPDPWPVAAPVPPAPPVHATVTANPHGLDPDVLFGVARRRNPKRSALFVSKVLAKHVPVAPSIAALAGLALGLEVATALGVGDRVPDDLAGGLVDPEAARAIVDDLRAGGRAGGPAAASDPAAQPLVLGFAETATSLGHLVRDALGGRLLLTTRLEAGHVPLATFEEEHSHATAHRVLHDDPTVLDGGAPVVLVDDELTTGRTALNTIEALHRRAPRSHYVVAGLLDWRDPEAVAAAEATARRLDATIEVVALLRGRVHAGLIDPTPPPPDPPPDPPGRSSEVVRSRVRLHRASGRHGWDPAHQAVFEAELPGLAARVADELGGSRVLCLGTEELMYLPIRLGEHLGDQARVQTTTRSPAVAADVDGYPLRHRRSFEHPGDPGRPSYVYNVPPGSYDDVVVLVDPGAGDADDHALVAGLDGAAPRLHVVRLEER